MASLIEELLNVLEKENSEYEILLELSKRKTPIIVQGDIVALQKITDEEQTIVGRIAKLEHKRESVTEDIANVINKDVETLKLSTLVKLLDKQPKEQQKLAVARDNLKATVNAVQSVNDQNRDLIKHAQEMVSFELNLLQAMKQAPETANYNKGAANSGEMLGVSSSFDAKQ